MIVPDVKPTLNPYLAMTSEKYLKEVTVGPVSALSGKVVLEEYDAAWKGIFEEEKEKIGRALGRNGIVTEHVGSTSVPGLCAKPVIDILLIVRDSSDENAYVPQLERVGYTMRIREPEWFRHRMLKKHNPEVNLHVFSYGCSEAKRMLDFRDWLRTNKGDRMLYGNTKKALVQREWHYLQDYADAKSEVVREIFSHEQAINQCAEFLSGLPDVRVHVCENTAAAAKGVAESGRLDVAALVMLVLCALFYWTVPGFILLAFAAVQYIAQTAVFIARRGAAGNFERKTVAPWLSSPP